MCYKKPAKPDVLQNKQLWSSGRTTAALWGTHSFGFWSSRTLVCKEKPHQNRVDWRLLWGTAHTFADWSQALKLGWLLLSNKINLPISTKVWRELKNKRPILEWCGLSWNMFRGHLKRMCVLLLVGGVLEKRDWILSWMVVLSSSISWLIFCLVVLSVVERSVEVCTCNSALFYHAL